MGLGSISLGSTVVLTTWKLYRTGPSFITNLWVTQTCGHDHHRAERFKLHTFDRQCMVLASAGITQFNDPVMMFRLGLQKPVVMWTTSTDPLGCKPLECSDLFFQRLLHLGLFPMPPMPSADHCLTNGSTAIHGQFLTYGPLFKALRGRTWVLRPHVADVELASTTTDRSFANCTGSFTPPSSTLPLRPPTLNVFRDLTGAELVVVTSPGRPILEPLTVTLNGFAPNTTCAEVYVTAIRPGEDNFQLVPNVTCAAQSVRATVQPCRGAVILRVGIGNNM